MNATYQLLPVYQVSLVREGSLKVPSRRFSNSKDIFEFANKLFMTSDREHFYVISLDAKNKMIGLNLVSIGSQSSAIVHPREVFKMLVIQSASHAIFVHNHPSGEAAPSREDRDCTRRLVDAGKLLWVTVLDSIIIGADDYFSFADAGLIEDMGANNG
jgi:DNA repair protein RadC